MDEGMATKGEWITDRPPAFEDGDEEGDVYVKYPEMRESDYTAIHWSMVMVGAHWRHTQYWDPPTHYPDREEWVTDRPPSKEDADSEGRVLSKEEYSGRPQYSSWDKVWRQPPWKHTPQWVPSSFEDANPSQGE